MEKLTGDERTADGVAIAEGLRVWTNDGQRGTIALDDAEFETNQNTGEHTLWFRVVRSPGDRGLWQSSDRVTTRFKGEPA